MLHFSYVIATHLCCFQQNNKVGQLVVLVKYSGKVVVAIQKWWQYPQFASQLLHKSYQRSRRGNYQTFNKEMIKLLLHWLMLLLKYQLPCLRQCLYVLLLFYSQETPSFNLMRHSQSLIGFHYYIILQKQNFWSIFKISKPRE